MSRVSKAVDRFLRGFDPDSDVIRFVGILELIPCALFAGLLLADISKFWNVSVFEGERVPIVGYLLLVAIISGVVAHAVGMIQKRAWAIVLAGPVCLIAFLWDTPRDIDKIANYTGEFDFKHFMHCVTSLGPNFLYLSIFFVSMRIINDWWQQRQTKITNQSTVTG